MSGVTGRDSLGIAFAKFGTNSWGVAASVTKGIYFNSDGGLTPQVAYVDDQSFGQSFLGQAEVGDFPAQDLTFVTRAKYNDSSHTWEALAMGSPATVTISTSAAGQTTSWLHVTDLAPSIDGLGLTLAIDKSLYIEELTSAKVYGFSYTGGDGGVLDQSFKVMGTKAINISSVNVRSTLQAITFPALLNRAFRKHGTFRMNAQGAGSLTSSNVLKLENISFDMSRPQDAPNVTGQDYIDEPADNGFPELTLTVNFPRMNTVSANSMYRYISEGGIQKADCVYAGNFINSTDRYTIRDQWPHLELQEWTAPLTGANQVKPVATMKAKKPDITVTSPAGFPFNAPFRRSRIMVNSVNAFA